MILSSIKNFYRKSPASEISNNTLSLKSLQWQVFISATIGYGLFYVCRLSLNVMKKSIADSGFLTETELGIIGSALFFAYAIGKFVNGFLADHSNIKRFMGTGLLISAIANLIMGFSNLFIVFVIVWGINGWTQSMGAPSAVVSLSRWFKDKDRGSFYGLWSTSHNIGEALTYIFTALVVASFGWRWGFSFAGIVGIIGVVILFFFFHDSPESKGFQPINTPSNIHRSTFQSQLEVLKNPYIWMLALSSAFMYIARYAVTSWGPYFFEAEKGYTITEANSLIAVSSVLGIFGTALSGIVSDKLFSGRRNKPVLIFGILNILALSLFLLAPQVWWIDITSMVLFGLSIGALICYLGGLMAVDIASKDASGAALGVVGIMSYLAAGVQDIISGTLIEGNKLMVNGVMTYDFSSISYFWIGAAVLSVTFALFTWKKT